MTVEQLTKFLGWCSVINVGFILLGSIMFLILRDPITALHASMFHMPKETVTSCMFMIFSMYKIAIFMFNIIPYIALRVIK